MERFDTMPTSAPPMNSEADKSPNQVPFRVDRRKSRFLYGNGDTPLEGYTIKRGLGIGGFGEVYHAQSASGKNVAIKRIVNNVDVEVRGVQQCLNVRHPNLIALHDLRSDDSGQAWVIMEMIEGESLRDRIDRSPAGIPIQEAENLFAQLVAAVSYLHSQGLVHRDLKPANVFIENGLVKVGDYGLSKFISATHRAGQTESVGTFHYMAPEIGKGEYGKEIDVYALGVIYFEMLTGDVPFDGESTQEIVVKHLSATPDVSLLPRNRQGTIARALEKDPTKRFRTAREFLEALGWSIDAAGLAVLKAENSLHDGGKEKHNVRSLPVAKQIDTPLSYNSPTVPQPAKQLKELEPSPRSVSSDIIAREVPHAEISGNKVRQLYREPIARSLHEFTGLYLKQMNDLDPGLRAVTQSITLIAILLFTLGGGWLIVCLAVACYAIYYPFYFVVSRTSDAIHLATNRVVTGYGNRALDGTIHSENSANSNSGNRKSFQYLDVPDRLLAIATSGFLWTGIFFVWGYLLSKSNNVHAIEHLKSSIWLGMMTIATVWGCYVIAPKNEKPLGVLKGWGIPIALGLLLGTLSTMLLELDPSSSEWRSIGGLSGLVSDAVSTDKWNQQVTFMSILMLFCQWPKLASRRRMSGFRATPIVLSVLVGVIAVFIAEINSSFMLLLPITVPLVIQLAYIGKSLANPSEVM